jgi:hypothetical protein
MTMRGSITPKNMHRSQLLNPWGIHRNQNLRLAGVPGRLRIGHHHTNYDFAARISGTRSKIFLAVDANPLIVLLDQNRHGLHR